MQVILDTHAPQLVNLTTAVAPTADSPVFQLLLKFSEPVHWLVDSGTTASSGASPNPANSTVSVQETVTETTVATFSSSSIMLSNAMLLNITAVPSTMAYLQSGASTGAASAYTMWVQSWAGAVAGVNIKGPAYQDLSSHKGEQDKAIRVRMLDGTLQL